MQGFKKNSFLFLFLILMSVTACDKNHTVKVPAGIIAPDTMVKVLADVHILQATIQMGLGQTMQDSSSKQAFDALWKKHNMTESDYNKSLTYYIDHPKLLDSIYDKVLNNLSQQKAELMGKKLK